MNEKEREVMQQALEALESLFNWKVDPERGKRCGDAVVALRAALAQRKAADWWCPAPRRGEGVEQVLLTDEEIESCRQKGYAHAGLGAPFDFGKAARAVENASLEKNK